MKYTATRPGARASTRGIYGCTTLPPGEIHPAVHGPRYPARSATHTVAIAVLVGLLGAAASAAQANFDIPTGAAPSPLMGATPFSQQMLMFEEFGTQPLPKTDCPDCVALPEPGDCSAVPPDSNLLDAFLLQPLSPKPRRMANTALPNAWHSKISECLGRAVTGVLEGRPPGEDFSHQRWPEFKPQLYFQSAQAGARVNGGIRDNMQKHHYRRGEFGPGGLYYNTTGNPGSEGTTAGIQIRLHPNLPVQDPTAVWTFDGTLPPKLLMARYGYPILFRHYNALPIDPAANYGFGAHTITTHEHNGHNPGESDGFAGAFFFPGEFYDYRWPMALAGHDHINTDASDPHASTPDNHGGLKLIRGDWRETMSTHWFHDHMLDFTAQNVYKGNAVMMNYYSGVDRGREPKNRREARGLPDKPGYGCNYEDPNNVNLCLPSGTAMDWGNRDYDVNLLVADKAWDADGMLYFNPFNLDGFLGDRMTVNWLYKPYLEVRARKYRFRILNGSVSRYFKIALVDQAGNRVPFYMIANDGNIMEHAVPFPNAESQDLPTQGIAERYDIVVDFSGFQEGDKLYLVNLLEHQDGRGPKQEIPLAEVLDGTYQAEIDKGNGDPAVGKFLELRVMAYSGKDFSMNPADYVEGKKTMIPRAEITAADLATAKHRTFEFGRSDGTDNAPWTIKTDGGAGLGMDPHRVSAAPDENTWEVWHIRNGGNGWSHPVHVHFEEGQILARGGAAPPLWEKWARKDVYRIGSLPDSTSSVDVAIRFREFMGTYVEHCHNTQHEDHAMLLRWDNQHPGQTIALPTPMPDWDGVQYEDTFSLPTAKTGDLSAAAAFQLP